MENENTPPFGKKKIRSCLQQELIKEKILGEILSRLPVKSLLRFRCVSKSWRSLIANKNFIKTHLQNYTKNQLGYDNWRVILHCDTHGLSRHGPDESSLHSYIYEPDLALSPIHDPKNPHLMIDTRVVDFCNGLLCIFKKPGCYFLWNPATRIYFELPKLYLQNLPTMKWGFGWEERSDAYKVFVGMSDDNQRNAQVYSLKTNSWKTVEHGNLPSFHTGVFAYGKIHWLIIETSGKDSYIESFDLESEVFGVVELPSKPGGGVPVSLLWEIEGCLSVVYSKDKRNRIWVMQQYEVKESWWEVTSWRRKVTSGSCCKPSPYIESLVSPLE